MVLLRRASCLEVATGDAGLEVLATGAAPTTPAISQHEHEMIAYNLDIQTLDVHWMSRLYAIISCSC